MLQVTIFDGPSDTVGKVIHADTFGKNRLTNTKIAKTINAAGSFEFDILPDNPGYSLLKEKITRVEIFNSKKGKLEFKGRVLSIQPTLSDDGTLYKEVICESQMAFLNDSIQSYKKVQMTPADFFEYLINVHNNQVDSSRQFKVGTVNVTNSTNYIYCYVEDGLTTFNEITTDLLDNDDLGGELRIRNESDGTYIDWINDPGTKGTQEIKLRKNMLSLYSKPDFSSFMTVLYPFGATINSDSTDTTDTASDVASPRLNISSVNDGKLYLELTDLINAGYGRIGGTKTWEDVNDASILKTKAQSYLNSLKPVTIGYELSAVDLFGIGLAIDDFDVGNYYHVINSLLGIDSWLRVISVSLDLNDPMKSTLTIGDKTISLSEFQVENKLAANAVTMLQEQAKLQQQKIAVLSKNLTDANKVIKDLTDIPDEISKIQQQIQELQNSQDKPGIHVGKIIDISEFQTDINFSSLKEDDVSLVIIRVQYGSNRADKYYQQNIDRAQSAGVKYAVYAYARYVSDTDAQREALDFYNRTKTAVGNGTGPVFYMIDIEESTVSSGTERSAASAWVSKMNDLGIPQINLVAYIANHLYDTFNIDVSQFGSIMIPSYGKNDGTVSGSTPPTHPYDLWQYTSVGSISGIYGNVDMSTDPSDRFKTQYLK